MKEEILDTCGICHLGVKHIDDYVQIAEYHKGRPSNTRYYHKNCFKERFLLVGNLDKLLKKINNHIFFQEQIN